LQTAAYIAHWISVLEKDEKIFVSACSKASQAVEFCRDLALAEGREDASQAA
jgi:antirestriction protein ArdC